MRFALALCLILSAGGCGPRAPDQVMVGSFDYSTVNWEQCDSAHSDLTISNQEQLSWGLKYSVRTPSNFQRALKHPLIVVWAPAGHHRFASEALTGLTRAATGKGFVIAYADSVRLSLKQIARLADLPKAIGRKWCVDRERVFFTGHSDGGTLSNALAFLPDHASPLAIAPSAAGIREEDMTARECPGDLSVLTLQMSNDELFPGYGAEMAAWWARCGACDETPREIGLGCSSFENCLKGTAHTLCTSDGGHRQWSSRNDVILSFFEQAMARRHGLHFAD
ncbi:MAG: poly(3-hydroxybutyrate) depolymerase [Pseudomonadota bacterium]